MPTLDVIESLAPGVLHTVLHGRVTTETARRIIEAGNLIMAEGQRLCAFHDWEDVQSYEPEARPLLTNWGVERRAQIDTVHILLRSGLTRMGVSLAAMVLGRMLKPYRARDAFEAAMAEAIRAR